jgi:hypothetical protein
LGLKDKIDIKEKKQKNSQTKDSKAAKGNQKNSATPSKDQTYKSWTWKKEKRYKPRDM